MMNAKKENGTMEEFLESKVTAGGKRAGCLVLIFAAKEGSVSFRKPFLELV
jgi:hypothetical protein